MILAGAALVVALAVSCQRNTGAGAPVISHREALPVLRSTGVSTLISDSGIIRYKIIAEAWDVYDQTDPTYWYFPQGLFLEKFNEQYHVDAYVTADTAYYYDALRLWELRGRVQVKNLKGETFSTELLFWDQNQHRIYSPAYMEIIGIEQQLSGYDFTSDEQMTDYLIHASRGAFPLNEKEHRQEETDSVEADSIGTDSVSPSPPAAVAPSPKKKGAGTRKRASAP